MLCFIFRCILWGYWKLLPLLRVLDLDFLSPFLDEGEREVVIGEWLAIWIIICFKFVVAVF